MNIFRTLLLGAAGLLLLPGCFFKKSSEIDTHQSLYVLNVLDKPEYDDCHIVGSIQVSLDQVESFAQKLNKDTEMVVYCSNYFCTASGQVAQQLQSLGFTKVWAYEAGMAEWFQRGLPVQGPCKQSYLKKVIPQPADHEGDSNTITTEQLYDKMKQAGLL